MEQTPRSGKNQRPLMTQHVDIFDNRWVVVLVVDVKVLWLAAVVVVIGCCGSSGGACDEASCML